MKTKRSGYAIVLTIRVKGRNLKNLDELPKIFRLIQILNLKKSSKFFLV